MQLGMIGLGRMGANLVRRLMAAGHECFVYDVSPAVVAGLVAEGAIGIESIGEFAEKMTGPRAVWVMVPAALTHDVVSDLATHLQVGDTIIDGGNSYYRDDIDRAAILQTQGMHYVDVGTSGGVFGLERGFCLMIGGEQAVVDSLRPIFETLAPGVATAERTPGRSGSPSPSEEGWLHCGGNGAGHFVKMVHNGIEYGMMQAFAEGLNVLAHADDGAAAREADAETTPLRDPQYYRLDIDVAEVTEVWRRGSVVASWLLDLTAAALHESPTLSEFGGRVSDSGEGRWTAQAAIDVGVPTPVLTASLNERFSSRGQSDYANKVLSAMRKQFGGHNEKPAN